MPEGMSISVNGQSQIPPGFRFHPTEEELLHYYLRKKVMHEKIDLDVISEVDLNKLEPWDIQEMCKIGTTPQNDWYFFSHKDKKYPTGSRTNRATTAGFWKATGRDKVIYSNCRRIGMRKTLVFYVGRAPNGQKSEWIMHEFRLDDSPSDSNEDGWVVCRIFKKKNQFKSIDNRIGSSMTMDSRKQFMTSSSSNNEGSLEQILQYMGRENGQVHERLMKLPSLECPNTIINQNGFGLMNAEMLPENISCPEVNQVSGISNWEELDQIVASHINVQTDNSRQFACFNEPTNMAYNSNSCNDNDLQLPPPPPLRSQLSTLISRTYHATLDEVDIWNFAKSSSSLSPPDTICQVSSAPV